MKKISYIIITIGIIESIIGIIMFHNAYWPGYETIVTSEGTTSIHGLPYFYPIKMFWALILITTGIPMIVTPLCTAIINKFK